MFARLLGWIAMKCHGYAREEWIARCAVRLARGETMTTKQAYLAAVACYEYFDDGESPEDAADEELLASSESA
jgi:hypothetical protein